jgi:hypothetical protein
MDSLVFQIATGVCLGMLAAGVIWKNWKVLSRASVALIVWGVILGGLGWAGVWAWSHSKKLLESLELFAGVMLLIGVMYGIPFVAYAGVMRRLPQLGPLVRGEAPWNQLKRLPVRLLVMACIAIGVALLGLGALMLVFWVIDKLGFK